MDNLQPNAVNASGGNEADPGDILEKLLSIAYMRAKRWATSKILLECVLFIGGAIVIFLPACSLEYPWIAFPVALVAVGIELKASKVKDKAEELKRQHEYLKGFGYQPHTGQLADSQLSLGSALSKDDELLLKKGITYWSKMPLGPSRTLENLIESAWYTKHHAMLCAKGLLGVVVVTLGLSISVLLLCATSLAGSGIGEVAAKFIAATMMFAISVGTVKTCLEYWSLATKAAEIDAQAEQIVVSAKENIFEVQRLLSEYQIARASAPLIPTWVWKLQRDSLNTTWEQLKHPTT